MILDIEVGVLTLKTVESYSFFTTFWSYIGVTKSLIFLYLCGVFTATMKWYLQVPRPQWVYGIDRLPSYYGIGDFDSYATPSAHASTLTLVLMICSSNQSLVVLIPITILGWLIIGLSRMYFAAHWPQDVMIGGIIGIIFGIAYLIMPFFNLSNVWSYFYIFWIILAFFALSLGGLYCMTTSPPLETFQDWKEKLKSDLPIHPERLNKSIYSLALILGILIGNVLRILCFPQIFPSYYEYDHEYDHSYESESSMTNELPLWAGWAALPASIFFAILSKVIASYFRKKLKYRLIKEAVIRIDRHDHQYNNIIVVELIINGFLHFFLSIFVTFLYPLLFESLDTL